MCVCGEDEPSRGAFWPTCPSLIPLLPPSRLCFVSKNHQKYPKANTSLFQHTQMHRQQTTSLRPSPASTLTLAVWHPHLVSVLDIEWLSCGGYVSHNAFVPIQPDAATGGLLHCGSLSYVEQAADQELSVGAVLAHLGPHTQSQQDVVTQENRWPRERWNVTYCMTGPYLHLLTTVMWKASLIVMNPH